MNIIVGTQINEYSLEIYVDKKVEKKKETHEVISVIEHEKRGQVIAMTDSYYGLQIIQTLDPKDKFSTILNKSNAYESKWKCKTLTDSVKAYIYTTQKDDKKVYEKLKKEIAKFVNKEYGKYCSYKMILDNIEI